MKYHFRNKEEHEFYSKVGKILKISRKYAGLTLMEVSEKVKCSHQLLQKYESSETKISMFIFIQLCLLYKLNPIEVLKSSAESEAIFSSLLHKLNYKLQNVIGNFVKKI